MAMFRVVVANLHATQALEVRNWLLNSGLAQNVEIISVLDKAEIIDQPLAHQDAPTEVRGDWMGLAQWSDVDVLGAMAELHDRLSPPRGIRISLVMPSDG